MFANSNGPIPGTNFAFPDVCKTPVGPAVVPIPYPNVTMSPTKIPSQFSTFLTCMPAQNLMSVGTVSMGDQPGVLLGVMSQMFMAMDRCHLGSFKTLIGTAFASRVTSLSGQNGLSPNAVGATISPSQVTTILLG
jgi:hypothetical protein